MVKESTILTSVTMTAAKGTIRHVRAWQCKYL